MTDIKEAAEKYAKELYKDMLFAVEWNKVNLEQEKKNAKNCAIVAVMKIIDATTNFNELTGVKQNPFFIEVLHCLEKND